jgi:hypothetical protein
MIMTSSLESLEDIFTYRDPPEAAPATITGDSVATAVPNTAHERQISQAIPTNERPNAPGEEQEDPEAQAQEDPRQAQKDPARVPARANPSAISSYQPRQPK